MTYAELVARSVAQVMDATFSTLDRPGGPLHASGLPECAACGGEILDEEAERSILYVDEDGNQARITVGDCCALALLADVLERKPGGHAEAEAFRVLREIAAEHEQGVWTRG
jgi:hypothetical protein